MNNDTFKLLNDVNRAIIKFRGIYSIWSYEHNISYNEMLVLYTIREYGFCTQKQVCDSYLLPRQTINNVITRMKKQQLLQISKDRSSGREKAFVLTCRGEAYAEPFLASLACVETKAVQFLGKEKLAALTQLMLEYDQALSAALKEA